jgi:hypothetical protein
MTCYDSLRDEIIERFSNDYHHVTFNNAYLMAMLVDGDWEQLEDFLIKSEICKSEYETDKYSFNEGLLLVFDFIADNCGVEFQELQVENAPYGLEFSNTGEMYSPTLIRVVETPFKRHNNDFVIYGCLGNLIEQYTL